MSLVSQILGDFSSFQLTPSRPSYLASVHFLWGRGKDGWIWRVAPVEYDDTSSSSEILSGAPAPWIKKKVKLGLLNLNQIEVLNGHK